MHHCRDIAETGPLTGMTEEIVEAMGNIDATGMLALFAFAARHDSLAVLAFLNDDDAVDDSWESP